MAAKNYEHTLHSLHDNHVLVNTREIFLYGREGDQCDVNQEVAMSFLKNIRFLDSISNKAILVSMYGRGGEVESGFIIHEAIRHTLSPVIMIVYGAACSVSSLILQAADLKIMTSTSYLMIHEGNSSISEDLTYKQSKAWHKFDEEIISNMTNIYAEACASSAKFKDKTAEQVKKYIRNRMNEKEDYILNPNEAVSMGMANGILGSEEYPTIEGLRQLYDASK